jgi:hypothetical protein
MRWLRRWGISIASLALGVATLFVFRRGLPHVGWIVGYLLLLWLVFAVLAELRAPLGERRQVLLLGAAEYTIQTLYHNLLLFVLPAYWASATLASPRAFVAGVAASAPSHAVDPSTARWPATTAGYSTRSWASMFAALNVALPRWACARLCNARQRRPRRPWPGPDLPDHDRMGYHARSPTVVVAMLGAVLVGGRSLVPPAPCSSPTSRRRATSGT